MEISFEELLKDMPWDDIHWNPTKLLTMKDRYRNTPEWFLSVSNRGPGKTYGVSWILLEYFRRTGRKFGLVTKIKENLGGIAKGVLNAPLLDRFPNWSLSEKLATSKQFSEIWISDHSSDETVDTLAGYCFAVNNSGRLKDFSSLFHDVDILFMDEFQSDNYVSREFEKFVNLHDSVARGEGQMVRYVPVILCSNSISIENPYFYELGISAKIQSNTHFYRGDGLVLERFLNKNAAEEREKSAFYRAIRGNRMVQSNIDNSWLNDNTACIAKPTEEWGNHVYLATLVDGDRKYGVRGYYTSGYWYVSASVDANCKNVWNITVDGVENVPMLRTGNLFVNLRRKYTAGQLRFANLHIKNRIVDVIYK